MKPLRIVLLLALTLTAPPSAQTQTHSADHGDSQPSAELVAAVRHATGRFQDVREAAAAGYERFLGCVSGPQEGAMGVHFVNSTLVGDGELDVAKPEALMYVTEGGQSRFVGVEYIVMAEAWHKAHPQPPVLRGQVFHFNGAPNRYGIPAFYELHVWAWRENPHGAFSDWNPRVSCDGR